MQNARLRDGKEFVTTTDNKTAKCSIEVNTWKYQSQGNTEYFAEACGYTASSYKSDKCARELLAKRIASAAQKYAKCEHNTKSVIVQCVDGTIIVCSFAPYIMTYQHSITGLDRERASYTTSSWKDIDECVQSAREHAAGSYGGVLKEYSF